MTAIRLIRALLLVAVISLVVLPAQAIRMGEKALDVTVGFAFVAGDQSLPAGSYRVRHPTGDIALIELQGTDRKKIVIVAVSRLARRPIGDGGKTGLVFVKVSGRYVLSEVWLEDLDGFLMLREGDAGTHEGQHYAAR